MPPPWPCGRFETAARAASVVDSSVPASRGSQPYAENRGPAQAEVPRLQPPAPPGGSRTSPFRPKARSQEPPLDGPASGDVQSSEDDRVPPPPPTPVEPR